MHRPASTVNKPGRLGNLRDRSGVGLPVAANRGANLKLPRNYTNDDFLLVRLHERRAPTISVGNQSRTSRAQHESKRLDTWRNEMNTSLNRGSARIYQFPVGGRRALDGRKHEESKPAANQGVSRVSEAAFGGGWYHEAAIQESEPERKR